MTTIEATRHFLKGELGEEEYNSWIRDNSTESRADSAYLTISLGFMIQTLFAMLPILVVVGLGLRVAGRLWLTIGLSDL